MSDHSSTTTAPHLIGHTLDITLEILLRLPVASVLRFRTVSKLWLSLSTSHYFLISHARHHLAPKPSALLLLSNETYSPALLHAPLTRNPAVPKLSLAFVEDDFGIRIVHSSNGLLLCYSNYKLTGGANGNLYVLNPTLKCFKCIPYPKCKSLDKPRADFTLVFDPAKAPVFELLCVWSSEVSFHTQRQRGTNQSFKIEMFSSENQTWRLLGEFTFQRTFVKQLTCGVYWHGAIHWLDSTTGPLCFHLETEFPKVIPAPPLHKEGIFSTERFAYLGVCNAQLSLIEARNLNSQFLDLLQLQTHESTWQLKHRISLDRIGTGCPEITEKCSKRYSENRYYEYCCFRSFYLYSVLSLVEEEEEDEDSLAIAMAIPGKIISFNPKRNMTKMLCPLPEDDQSDVFSYKWINAHKLIQSFSCF
uniref:F-box domain-containing protein n=1 Tax=Kalanchoe fedtschenkoi TaxID=63787 RepID=A0A7N0TZ38_KALFE